jgi:hypothetical protein
LAEGRKPALRVASDVAAAKEETAEYIRFRAFDDGYFCDLILTTSRPFIRDAGPILSGSSRVGMDILFQRKLLLRMPISGAWTNGFSDDRVVL